MSPKFQFRLRSVFAVTLLIALSLVVVSQYRYGSFVFLVPSWIALASAVMTTSFRSRALVAGLSGTVGGVTGLALTALTLRASFPAGLPIAVFVFACFGAVIGLVVAIGYQGILQFELRSAKHSRRRALGTGIPMER